MKKKAKRGGANRPDVSRTQEAPEIARAAEEPLTDPRAASSDQEMQGALENLRLHQAGIERPNQESFHLAILDSITTEIAVLDRDGVIVTVNEPWRRFARENGARLGVESPSSAVGANYLSACRIRADSPDDSARKAVEGIRAVLDRRQAEFTTEYPCHSPEQERWFSMSATPLGRDAHGVVIAHTNITERRRAQAEREVLEVQLRESQKMEAIGTLAGGIAHEFNNVIATILGNARLATDDVQGNAKALESLEEIRKAGRRAADLVQSILAFSRREPNIRSPVAMAPVVEDAVNRLRPVVSAGIVLDLEIADDLPDVLANANQVSQVILNLINNAMHAVRGAPGRIAVRLDEVDLDTAVLAAHADLRPLSAKVSDRVVRLTVRDDGCGMGAAEVGRIFEPFYTTKPVNEGTGLGLSVVHGIVEAHEGVITVDSSPGRGATFAIYLRPLETGHEPARAERDISVPIPASVAAAGQRMLYVDDDEPLVFLLVRTLERLGYHVSGFTEASAALDAIRADPSRFDLVVSDYNMPGISGLDVAREVRAIRPDLPVAVATGFIDKTLRGKADGAGVDEVIFKAATVEDFGETVARWARDLVMKA